MFEHRIQHITAAVLGLVFAVSPGLLRAKDDDFEFAKSLAEKGYDWLAEEELENLANSANKRERILSFLVKAEMYKRQNKLPEMIAHYKKFSEEAESSTDPEIRGVKRDIDNKLWDLRQGALRSLINDIEAEFHKKKPDQEKLRDLRKKAAEIGKDIVEYRRKVYKELDEKMGKTVDAGQDFEVKWAQCKLFLARTLYYYSFAFKGSDESKRRTILEEAHKDFLNDLMFSYGETVILIPYFDGMVLWELKKHKEAAVSFKKCNGSDYFIGNEKFDPIRKVAYERTVRSFFMVKHYKSAAEEAFNYLLDFPSEKDKKSFQGQTVRITLAKAIWEMPPSSYKDIKDKFNWKKAQQDKAVQIAEEIESESGYKAAEARELLRNWGGGFLRDIIEGVAQYHEKDYQKAVSVLQKGLKAVPESVSMDKKLTKVAQAWYYLGFSYYHLNMKLPAVIAFKEGTTRFMKLFKDNRNRLNETQKQWYLENRKNWKTMSGLYYRDNRSQLAVDIFKEALIAYSQDDIADKKAGQFTNVNVNLSIIMAKNNEYREALKELEKVGPESSSYMKALRLKGKFTWALFKNEDKKDTKLTKKAFGYFKELKGIIKKEANSAVEAEDKKYYHNELAETDAFLVQMRYGIKQYEKIVNGIETFWKNPPQNRELAFSTARYQIYSVIQMKPDESKKGIEKNFSYHMKACALMEKIRREFPDKEFQENINNTVKALGFSFFNLSRKLDSADLAEQKKEALNRSGGLLYDFIMGAGKDVDERYLIAVADILFKRLKDFKRSEEVTKRILEIFQDRIADTFPPYSPETEKQLEGMKESLFDREDARNRWGLLIDRMVDRKKEGKQITREMFKNIRREAWPENIGEKPYMYEEAYVWLSEAVMLELGYPEEKRKELAKQRDSEKGEAAEAFWKKLIHDYKESLNKDPKYLIQIHTFLDNAIFANNYKDRLAECYFANKKYEKAYKLYSELDDYYIFEPVTKAKMGETLLCIARSSKDPEKVKEYAVKAKNIYLWIKLHAPAHIPEGQKEHFDAAFKIAECYKVMGDPESAKRSLVNVRDFGTVQYPDQKYEEKLKALIAEYDKLIKDKTGKQE